VHLADKVKLKLSTVPFTPLAGGSFRARRGLPTRLRRLGCGLGTRLLSTHWRRSLRLRLPHRGRWRNRYRCTLRLLNRVAFHLRPGICIDLWPRLLGHLGRRQRTGLVRHLLPRLLGPVYLR